MVAPRSASVACAVIPTAVPFAAFSATLPPLAPSVSVGPTTGLSLRLVTATANVVLLIEPSLEVANTVMLWLVELSASSSVPFARSEEHTSELQSHVNLVCRLLLEKKKTKLFPSVSRKQKQRQKK